MFDTVGGSVFATLAFVGFGIWALNKQFKKFDSEGKIAGAARTGVLGIVTRFFK